MSIETFQTDVGAPVLSPPHVYRLDRCDCCRRAMPFWEIVAGFDFCRSCREKMSREDA